MRNFQEEVGEESKRLHGESDVLNEKAKVSKPKAYRALIGVASVLAIVVALIVVAATSGSYSPPGSKQPKALVFVVPGLNPLLVESAMAANKASTLAMLTASGSAYGRVASNMTDPVAALISLLTGTPVSYHNVTDVTKLSSFQNGATSFLRYAAEASLTSMVMASEKYFSGSNYASSGQCDKVGILDVECVGLACPAQDTASYCNALTKVLLSNDDASLMGSTISSMFVSAAPTRSMVTVVLDSFSAMKDEDDNNLRALSIVSLLDGVIGQMLITLERRSFEERENWLLVVAGDGVNALMQAPLFVIPVSAGSVIRAQPINSNAGNIVDLFPTLQKWFGFPSPSSVKGMAQGLCNAGSVMTSC